MLRKFKLQKELGTVPNFDFPPYPRFLNYEKSSSGIRGFIKALSAFWIFSLISLLLLLALGITFLKENYLLNRAVREVALKLTQVEVLSRTTEFEYRAVFSEDHLQIDFFNKETQDWKNFMRHVYSSSVSAHSGEEMFLFARGAFRQFLSKKEDKGVPPRYVSVDFHFPGSGKKKSIIFFRKGDWRVSWQKT